MTPHPFSREAVKAAAKAVLFVNNKEWMKLSKELRDRVMEETTRALTAAFNQSVAESRPMTGFFATLSAEQKKKALSYTGDEVFGNSAFKRINKLEADLASALEALKKAETRVAELEKKFEPSRKARIASLKRTIAHYKKEIEWKYKDDVDHTFDSVMVDLAEKQLNDLRRAAAELAKHIKEIT